MNALMEAILKEVRSKDLEITFRPSTATKTMVVMEVTKYTGNRLKSKSYMFDPHALEYANLSFEEYLEFKVKELSNEVYGST